MLQAMTRGQLWLCSNQGSPFCVVLRVGSKVLSPRILKTLPPVLGPALLRGPPESQYYVFGDPGGRESLVGNEMAALEREILRADALQSAGDSATRSSRDALWQTALGLSLLSVHRSGLFGKVVVGMPAR